MKAKIGWLILAFVMTFLTGCDELIPDIEIPPITLNTTSELGHETLERVDRINEILEDGVIEIGPETRKLIEDWNETVKEGIGLDQETLARVDRLLSSIEAGVGITVTGGLTPETRETVEQLIDTIDDAPDKWGTVGLQIIDALEQSGTTVAQQMATQIKDLMSEARINSQRLTASVGSEFRCNVDFLGARAGSTVDEFIGRSLIGSLRSIISGKEIEPTTPVPWVCGIIPDQVNLIVIDNKLIYKDKLIIVSGYNYVDANLPGAYIVNEAGVRIDTIPLNPYRTSPYQIQLNLQDIDLTNVPARSRLVFSWSSVSETSAIAIILPDQPTPTPTPIPQPELVINISSVDIYEGPGTNYKLVGTAQLGAKYLVTGKNGDETWWQIKYEGSFAWVPAENTIRNDVLVPVATNIPLPPPTDTPTPEPTNTPTDTPTPTNTPTETPTNTPTATPPIPREEYVDGGDGKYVEDGMHACPPGYAIAGVHANNNRFLCRRVMRYGEEEFVMTVRDDKGTSRSGMHACPMGMYMRGLHISENDLLCSFDSRTGGPSEWSVEFEDSGSNRSSDYGMHICPQVSGNITYLTGIHVNDNRFLCGIHQR